MSQQTTPTTTPRSRLPSRPTTPLRPSSRTSLRTSLQASTSALYNPLDALESQFAELSDGMADLEANFLHLQLMHESLARFSESFAAFLYGLNMNAFCVEFGEQPLPESFERAERWEDLLEGSDGGLGGGGDMVDVTFLTTDTSFVEHPPLSSKAGSSKPSTPRGRGRGGAASGRGRGGGIPRASGIARGTGIPRGRGRGSRT